MQTRERTDREVFGSFGELVQLRSWNDCRIWEKQKLERKIYEEKQLHVGSLIVN